MIFAQIGDVFLIDSIVWSVEFWHLLLQNPMKEIKNAINQETFQFLLKNNIEGVFLTENGPLASPQFS